MRKPRHTEEERRAIIERTLTSGRPIAESFDSHERIDGAEHLEEPNQLRSLLFRFTSSFLSSSWVRIMKYSEILISEAATQLSPLLILDWLIASQGPIVAATGR
jgi:hypothetical protein